MKKKHYTNCNIKTKPKATLKKGSPLKVLRWEVAGIDLGSKSHFVAIPNPEDKGEVLIREFSALTSGLTECINWLKENKTKYVVMESTGVYWLHFYSQLESNGFEVVLANARHVKNVKGKKTDISDAEWLMQLHSYGLLEGSFVPSGLELSLRTFHRSREQSVRMMSQANQRIQKALVSMNLRLDMAVNDITGKTGMAIIKAILSGERNPQVLAESRDPRCKKSKEEIAEALNGCYRDDLLFTLKKALKEYEFHFDMVREVESEIEKLLHTFPIKKTDDQIVESEKSRDIKARKRRNQRHERVNEYSFDVRQMLIRMLGVDLMKLPGISEGTALAVVSEIGTDMSKWPTFKQFSSWLKLTPNNQISGGKILRNGNYNKSPAAARALRMAVSSLYREKNPTALGVFFRRLKSKKGPRAAITAGAHKLARLIYNLLKTGKPFIEPGAEAYLESQKNRRIASMRSQLNEWGYSVKRSTPIAC